MKKNIFFLLLFSGLIGKAQNNLNIVPMPAEVKMGKGNLIVKEPLGFILNDNINPGDGGISLFKQYLKKNYGIIKFIDGDTHSYGLPTEIFLDFSNKAKSDGYEIEITKKNITISGNANGLFYAFETLKQIIRRNSKKQITLPVCKIKDYPRFPYRGMHLDVGRHFFPVSFIKKYIDYLAAYKYNTFHWHLTEDQGWRIEIKKYPLLTQVGGCRDRTLIGRYGSNKYDSIKYCGYYTQQQIKEIVQYAADRYITVIPEIEMPGHSTAALASYPYLGCTKGPYKVMDTWGVLDDVYCAGNDSTFTFLQNVLDEVMQLFPSKYIHIGGDECPKERWKTCPLCQKRIKDNNLKDEHALQSYFIQHIEKYLNSKGRKIIGWDEILEGGLAPNATVMSWRGEEGGIEAAKQNHDVIMTPGSHCYLDHSQSKNEDSVTIGGYLPLEKVYSYEPIPAALNAEQAKHVLGAQGNVWTEYMANISKVEYMIFPRMIALSEVLWSPKDKRDWSDFERRLPIIFERLDKQKINYSKAIYEPKINISSTPGYEGIYLSVNSKQEKSKYYFGNKTENQFLIYTDSISTVITKSGLYGIRMLGKPVPEQKGEQWGNAQLSPFENIFSADLKFNFNKATGKKITLVTQPNKSYAANGAFTLVDGVQNEKGMAKSSEFLGFLGTDMDATIDLGKDIDISKVTLHVLKQNGSWIYLPSQVEVSYIPYFDSTQISRIPPIEMVTVDIKQEDDLNKIEIKKEKFCRYVHIRAKNFGIIPSGKPGAGNPAWLFVDEIEVQ